MSDNTNLTDSFTFFLYDFKIKNPISSYPAFADGNKGIWKRSAVKPDESFLFPHVQDFFTKNSGLGTPDENHFIVYELKRDNLNPEEKLKLSLFNNLFSKSHFMTQLGKGKENINFNMISDGSVLSPKLFICPITSIGIFTFCFKLSESHNTLENLLNFNFKARIISSGQEATLGTLGNPNPQALEREMKTDAELAAISKGKIKSDFQSGNTHSWSLRTFINYFFQDIDEKTYQEISSSRLQAFTYAQTEKKLQKDELRLAIFRMRRMYNYNYFPPEYQQGEDQECFQPFEQIHFGASVEGVAVLINEDKELVPEFLKSYEGVLKQRSLWTYILAYHQRLALIVGATEVSELYSGGKNPSLNELSVIVKKITKVQLKCMFNEISHFTQQNDFYYLCCKNLRLPSLFQEVKEELSELNNTLAEEWHKEEELARLTHMQQEKIRERNFSTLVGMLMVPQIWFAMVIVELDDWHHFLVAHEQEIYVATFTMWGLIFAMAIKMYFFGSKSKKVTVKELSR